MKPTDNVWRIPTPVAILTLFQVVGREVFQTYHPNDVSNFSFYLKKFTDVYSLVNPTIFQIGFQWFHPNNCLNRYNIYISLPTFLDNIFDFLLFSYSYNFNFTSFWIIFWFFFNFPPYHSLKTLPLLFHTLWFLRYFDLTSLVFKVYFNYASFDDEYSTLSTVWYSLWYSTFISLFLLSFTRLFLFFLVFKYFFFYFIYLVISWMLLYIFWNGP